MNKMYTNHVKVEFNESFKDEVLELMEEVRCLEKALKCTPECSVAYLSLKETLNKKLRRLGRACYRALDVTES